MITNFTFNRQVLELAKNDDHFMLVYPNTRTGALQQDEPCGTGWSMVSLTSIAVTRGYSGRPLT